MVLYHLCMKKLQQPTYIYGKHAVSEALLSVPQAIKKVFLTKQTSGGELRTQIDTLGIPAQLFDGGNMPKGVDQEAVHQGVIAEVTPEKLTRNYKTWIDELEVTNDTALVILGEVQDPHNVGAVIRSAAGFGVSAVLLPEHNQAPITGTVVKVSAGMAFSVPLVQIGNVNTVVKDLKDRGFWMYGLEGESDHSITDEQFDRPTVFILGNESRGIREKTREHCDILLSIPLDPACESLNAAASASVALYEWKRQRGQS